MTNTVGVTTDGTSAGNPLRVDWIDTHYVPLVKHAGGRLGMTFLPGKRSPDGGRHHRRLDEDAARLRDAFGCDLLVVLAEVSELAALGIEGLEAAMGSTGVEVQIFVLPEGATPDRHAFRRFLDGLIRKLLAGSSVVVASRHGRGRTGLMVACLVRDLGEYDADFAMEWVSFYRKDLVETPSQQLFVRRWEWPRRAAVAKALAKRRKVRAIELARFLASLSDEDAQLHRLGLGLRKTLWGEEVEAAYLAQPQSHRPARMVCYLLGARDPDRLVRRVKRSARRFIRLADFAVIVGPMEPSVSSVLRILPAASPKLGE